MFRSDAVQILKASDANLEVVILDHINKTDLTATYVGFQYVQETWVRCFIGMAELNAPHLDCSGIFQVNTLHELSVRLLFVV